MTNGDRIIDYVMEQADKNDGLNLKIEQGVIQKFTKIYDNTGDRVLEIIDLLGENMNTTLKMQIIMNKITDVITDMYNQMYNTISPMMMSYYQRGYDQTDELIEVATDLYNKATKVHEMKLNPDANTTEYLRNHSFEMVKGISDEMIQNMRMKLSSMLIQQQYNKKDMSDAISQTLHVNRSRAQMIAQTEMSLAYNAGVIERMNEFNTLNGKTMKKYWYGFKYSEVTCSYCRPRIGNVYDVDDNSEQLPAHPRCRCVWLPYVDGWDTPISSDITRKADMLKRTLQPDEVYNKINTRLGIDYADYIDEDTARRYLAGDRSSAMKDALLQARDKKIKDTIDNFDISSDSTTQVMDEELQVQMDFWKKYTAQMMTDNNTSNLEKAYEAIKGVMVLPWSGEQLHKWNELLQYISKRF